MHPLLDRRDLTAQRDQPQVVEHEHVDVAQLAAQLAETNRLLRGQLEQEQADIVQLCVTDGEVAESIMDDFPIGGTRRLIVRRTGAGGSFVLAAATPVPILQPNENRLGARIGNTGANPITLFLSRDLLTSTGSAPLSAGAAQIVLAAGAAWDMLLGNLLWCGGLVAVAAAGGSSASVAEV